MRSATPNVYGLRLWPAQTTASASLTMAAALACRLPSSRVRPPAATTARLYKARAAYNIAARQGSIGGVADAVNVLPTDALRGHLVHAGFHAGVPAAGQTPPR